LVLHFSDFSTIFYEFYKIQHLHLDLEETVLRTGPRISQTGPRNEKLDCNWIPGAMAGGGSSIPARGRLGLAGKGQGSGVGSPRVPFRGLLAAEEQPVAVLGDAGGMWPQGASASACWPAMLRNRQLGRPARWWGGGGAASRMRRHAETGARRGGVDGGRRRRAHARTADSGFYSLGEQARLQAFLAKEVPRASMP
jgi:hypothetical protein